MGMRWLMVRPRDGRMNLPLITRKWIISWVPAMSYACEGSNLVILMVGINKDLS